MNDQLISNIECAVVQVPATVEIRFDSTPDVVLIVPNPTPWQTLNKIAGELMDLSLKMREKVTKS